jgi:hypothetical protein
MIVAVQYYEGDMERALSLARLLADIQPRRRDDVLLSLACQPGTPATPLLDATLKHCARKFPTEAITSRLGAVGHPQGCTALFAGVASHYCDRWNRGELEHDAIFMVDGGDSVPLHPDWIDIATREHDRTCAAGKLITGTPYFLGTCPLLINPVAIYELSTFERTKIVKDVPRYDGTLSTHFDVYHRAEMIARTRPSSIVRTDWRGAGRVASVDLLRSRARESLWLHGYKDERLHWICREWLATSPPPPQIQTYDLANLQVHELVRRNFEASSR